MIRAENNYSINNIMHNTFYANLNSKGFPQQAGIRNVSISNGSECGSLQNFNAGDLLIEANGYGKTGFIGDIIGGYVLPVFGFAAGALVDPSFFAVGALNLLPGSSRFDAKL
ncbi:MAG: hypothetical protein ACK4JX_04285 [Flavobacterium sp.]